MRFFADTLRSIIDFVYPPLCLSCDELLADGSELVCANCLSAIPQITVDHPLYIDTRRRLCSTGAVDDLVSAFVFEKQGNLQKIIHALKYSNIDRAGVVLGRCVGEEAVRRGIVPAVLVPVPLHKAKERDRGYNQAAMVAQGIACVCGGKVEQGLLQRVRNTRTQTKLSLEKRKENMDRAFVVRASDVPKLRNATVLIVDDVITTGATILSCARALKEAGAARVVAASAALAAHKD